jgi:tetratricopeptide (TPR) repeat protein
VRRATSGSSLAFAIAALLVVAATVAGQEVPRPDLGEAEPLVRQRLEALANRTATRPRDAEAWGRYAMALDAHELTAAAAVAYRRAHELDPDEQRWPYLLATLLDLTDPQASLPYYERALDLDPDYAPAHVRAAEALERLARVDEAAAHYRKALRLDPSNPFGPFGLGRLALLRSDLEEAVRYLEQARALDPEIKALTATLAQALYRRGESERARELARAAKSMPRNTYRPDPIRAAVKSEGADVRSILARSKSHRDKGRLEAALREARQAVEVAPDFASAHFTVAEIELLLGNAAAAVAPARRAAELDPQFALVPPFLAQLLFRLRRFEEAERWARRSVELEAEAAAMHLLLSMTAAQRGDVEAVVAHLDRAYELRPREAATRQLLQQLLIDLADSFAGAGARRQAIESLEKALSLVSEGNEQSDEAEELRRRLAAYRGTGPGV